MRLPITCTSPLKKGLLSALLSLWLPYVQAVSLNFSAVIQPGTCSFSLSAGTVNLGILSMSSLQPATLVDAKPFTLAVSNCRGIDAGLTPVVSITGSGVNQGSRWLFRAADSEAHNVGVMLIKSSVMPDYSTKEVMSGDTVALAKPGSVPSNQDLSFYAGATCVNAASCSNIGTGALLARITFSLDYR